MGDQDRITKTRGNSGKFSHEQHTEHSETEEKFATETYSMLLILNTYATQIKLLVCNCYSFITQVFLCSNCVFWQVSNNKWVFGVLSSPLYPENAIKDDDRIARAAGLFKELVGHFSHSYKQKVALKEAQKEHSLPEHSLITECPTRWGSRQKMIARVLEQQRAISDILSAVRLNVCILI